MGYFPPLMPQSRISISTFSRKDFSLLVLTMLPLSGLINFFLFGQRYFSNLNVFLPATAVTFAVLGLAYMAYGQIFDTLRIRFPEDHQLTSRLALTLAIFILISGVLLSIVFRGYELIGFLGYKFNEQDFSKAYICLVIMNVFLTFLNEGIDKFESYKATVTETEQLKKEYMHSQLLGLKSQVNPHFLFNSLNTLSSLINEDSEKAEVFLDEMSKVYRYLLRNNEEQLVSLETELGFLFSYYYLLRERHGDGLQLEVDAGEEAREGLIPPLTLQTILENTINTHAVSKDRPLQIRLQASGDCSWLEVVHGINPKVNTELPAPEAGLENITNKIRLLCGKSVEVGQTPECRTIRLPLIGKEEVVAL
ncbi:MAG TPA: histidine kinase [Chitinophagaceae bacterium]|nr:histidine kinase [Chitinophagaceae bacterium]